MGKILPRRLTYLLLAVSSGAMLWGGHAVTVDAKNPDFQLVFHLMTEVVQGHLNGSTQNKVLSLAGLEVEPGDIVAFHNPGGGYGYWTHVVLYVGSGNVVDSNDFVRGTVVRHLGDYTNYEEAVVLRVKTNPEERHRAAWYGVREVGKAYDPFSSLQDSRSEYCSKLVWVAYKNAGLQLVPSRHWIVPDDIVQSAKVHIMVRREAQPR